MTSNRQRKLSPDGGALGGLVVLFALCAACGGQDPGSPEASTSSNEPPPDENTLRISTPELVLGPGEEKTFCYFTSLPTTETVAVKRYVSAMTEGSHHMIVFLTREPAQPEGTFAECNKVGLASGVDVPLWAYASQEAEGELVMPEGVGVELAAGQPIMVQMHYLNAGGAELAAHVDLEIDLHPEGAQYTPANVFATFNTQIEIPPGGSATVEGSCTVPKDANFFVMSTHSHHFTTHAEIRDGSSLLVDTSEWDHPGVADWGNEPYTFASGKLTYRCEYQNPTTQMVRVGESAQTAEMCMAVGYFHPATEGVFCLNSTVLPW